MSLSLSDLLAPTFTGGLHALNSFIDKAAAHADADALLGASLAPDMFSFTQQIQTATDHARRGLDRLAGREPSSVADDETSFADLRARVERTLEHVKATDWAAVNEGENRQITLEIGQKLEFTGRNYVLAFLLPNFWFHVTTAYDILRHNGLDVGKRDFVAPFVIATMR